MNTLQLNHNVITKDKKEKRGDEYIRPRVGDDSPLNFIINLPYEEIYKKLSEVPFNPYEKINEE